MKLTDEDYRNGFFPTTSYDIPEDATLKDLFSVPIYSNKLIGFCDAFMLMIYANDVLLLELYLRLWEVLLSTSLRHNLSLLEVQLNLNSSLLIMLLRLHNIYKSVNLRKKIHKGVGAIKGLGWVEGIGSSLALRSICTKKDVIVVD